MRHCALMRCYQSFPTAIPLYEAGYPRVTHPSATKLFKNLPKLHQRITPFDLHVLGTPPAFILSQDRTLTLMFVLSGSELHWLNQNNSAPLLFLTAWWWLNHQKFTLVFVLLNILSFLKKKNWNFQGCITVKLSKYFQKLLPSGFQAFVSWLSFTATCYMLTRCFVIVKNFFRKDFRLLTLKLFCLGFRSPQRVIS